MLRSMTWMFARNNFRVIVPLVDNTKVFIEGLHSHLWENSFFLLLMLQPTLTVNITPVP